MSSEKGKVVCKSPKVVSVEAGKTYYWCACGQSTNQPFCDGSHQHTKFVPKQFIAEKSENVYLCMCKQTNNPPFCDGTHKSI